MGSSRGYARSAGTRLAPHVGPNGARLVWPHSLDQRERVVLEHVAPEAGRRIFQGVDPSGGQEAIEEAQVPLILLLGAQGLAHQASDEPILRLHDRCRRLAAGLRPGQGPIARWLDNCQGRQWNVVSLVT